MSNIYELFATSPTLEAQGIEVHLGKATFRVAFAGGDNVKYRTSLQRALQPYKRTLDALDNDIARALMIEVYADSIVLGWSGVVGRDGEAIPFTHENVIKLLTDLPQLFAQVQEVATTWSAFKADSEANGQD